MLTFFIPMVPRESTTFDDDTAFPDSCSTIITSLPSACGHVTCNMTLNINIIYNKYHGYLINITDI